MVFCRTAACVQQGHESSCAPLSTEVEAVERNAFREYLGGLTLGRDGI
jgi:hypothetical protein